MFRTRVAPMLYRLALVLFAATWPLLPWIASAGSARGFTAGSLDDIVKTRIGRPFVLVLWSLDCPPCIKELDVLVTQLQTHPETDVVMVATDPPSARPEVEAMLAKHRLDDRVESWIFAEDNDQKLRYAIDPNWYGELPRSYFYDSMHQRVALSGAVTERHFEAWRATNRPKPRRHP